MKVWPWEGNVQAVFVELLIAHEWTLESIADTGSKAPGVDVLATKGTRSLGAEVKGFPSVKYEDIKKAHLKKRSSPNGQAVNWYAKGILAALRLPHHHPSRESILVLPDATRYRELLNQTQSRLEPAGVHVVLLREDATFDSTFWKAE